MNAKEIILKAANCEKSGFILEAQMLFEDAIHLLRNVVADEQKTARKEMYNQRISEYSDHVEQIKEHLKYLTINSKLIDQIHIPENSRGNSYKQLFSQYMTSGVKEVIIYEPYMTDRYHFKNLICFLEMMVKKCRQLRFIRVVTKVDTKLPKNQLNILQHIRNNMSQGGITFNFTFDNALHDRKIVLGSGVIIKIGRGLHFYQPIDPAYSLGLCDYDFRRCLQTDIDILRGRPFSDVSSDS